MRTFLFCALVFIVTGVMWFGWAMLYFAFGIKAMVAARWWSVLVVFVVFSLLAEFVRHLWSYLIAWSYIRSGRRMVTAYMAWIPTSFFGIALLIRLWGTIGYMSEHYPDAFNWECWAMGIMYGLLILHEMVCVFVSPGRLRATEIEVWGDTHCTRY